MSTNPAGSGRNGELTRAIEMARLSRAHAPGIVQHLVQRAAGDRVLFVEPDDYAHALRVLGTATRLHRLALHAYVLLPREIRLVGTPGAADSTSRVFQALGRAIAPRANRRDGRSGAVWDRRYRSGLLDADRYLLSAMRYVERRPVAAGVATSALEWRWSSAAHHVGLHADTALDDHAAYWSLRDTPFGRQAAYRQWLDETTVDAANHLLERSVETGWALGDAAFIERVEQTTGRRLAPLPRGRPRLNGLTPNQATPMHSS